MRKLLVACALAFALAPSALAANTPAKPVPSLTPAATHKLWLAEVERARAAKPRVFSETACRPARAVFYAQTDWLRLATKLAQASSACANYYISVPPLSADKTQARANQAAQIRALGPSFHALDEISWNGWSSWVTAGNGTWYDAGVLARQRMAAAGFDAAAGDTWALNELSSAVRKGTGAARQNARDFIRGLGSDGVKGVVFVAGIGQLTSDLGLYKVNLQSWLQDAAFWNDVAPYVSDWQQEAYGDVRAYAAAGTTPQQRRDALGQYLGHELALANVGPEETLASRSLLQSTYSGLGNAAWAWSSAYGWTAVPYTTMQDYVSAQVYASRALSASAPVDRVGFAWAPSNTLGLATTDYNAQTAAILERIAQAIRDSAAPSADPGSGACAPSWCTAALDGAALTSSWQTFASWSLPSVGIVSAPAALTAGSASGALTLQWQRAGIPEAAPSDQVVTLASSSPAGAFASAPGGPWSATLDVTIAAGSSAATFYYLDTRAGSATLSAALAGQSPATQTATVAAAPLARVSVTPASAYVLWNRSVALTAAGFDAYGNAVPATVTWSINTTAYGRLSTTSGSSTTFIAAARNGTATVTARAGAFATPVRITVSRW